MSQVTFSQNQPSFQTTIFVPNNDQHLVFLLEGIFSRTHGLRRYVVSQPAVVERLSVAPLRHFDDAVRPSSSRGRLSLMQRLRHASTTHRQGGVMVPPVLLYNMTPWENDPNSSKIRRFHLEVCVISGESRHEWQTYRHAWCQLQYRYICRVRFCSLLLPALGLDRGWVPVLHCHLQISISRKQIES